MKTRGMKAKEGRKREIWEARGFVHECATQEGDKRGQEKREGEIREKLSPRTRENLKWICSYLLSSIWGGDSRTPSFSLKRRSLTSIARL